MSSNDLRQHFGLGSSTTVDKVEIHWPDGKQETVALTSVDRYFAIEEGKGLVPSLYDAIARHRKDIPAAHVDKSKPVLHR
jgi:enediyne biosynthesis protein E4